MKLVIALFMSCGLGALIRYYFSRLNALVRIPIGTLLVNLLAAFLIGYFYNHVENVTVFLILSSGFLGGLGTYSTLNFEFVQLLKNPKMLMLYLLLTYGLGLVFVWFGMSL